MTVSARDPSEEGDYTWGCFYKRSDDLASVADSWSEAADIMRPVFKEWDAFMKASAAKLAWVTPADARRGSLGWLLGNAGKVFDEIRHLYMFPCDSIAEEDERKRRIDEHLDAQEAGRTDVPDPTLDGWTPNEIRDWFCWLHRHFVYCAREGAL